MIDVGEIVTFPIRDGVVGERERSSRIAPKVLNRRFPYKKYSVVNIMAFTRFKYDESRTTKQLQQSTDPGRWVMNVPGNGDKPHFIEDPHIRIQAWGANLRTNIVDLEGELRGSNRRLGKDCLGKDNYQQFQVNTEPIQYPTTKALTTE